MPDRRPISTESAPAAIGPYNQAMRSGHLIFCSGQIPLDPSSGELVKLDVAGQTRRVLDNLQAICQEAKAELAWAVKCTIYLTDIKDFAIVNEVYAEYFDDEPPARVTVAVAGLPKGADVEIDAIVAV
jgi:2-iminobutanoate/2-iminopropanoate deaminase